jgi:hypothetical protein
MPAESTGGAGPPADAAAIGVVRAAAAMSDLVRGVPDGTAARAADLAARIAARGRLDADTAATAAAVALLRCAGFVATAPRLAAAAGDDIAASASLAALDSHDTFAVTAAASRLGRGVIQRAWSAASIRSVLRERDRAGAEIASRLAHEFGLAPTTVQGTQTAFERWDGKGSPGRARAEQIPVAVRVAQVADLLAVAGWSAGLIALSGRAGASLDPALCAGVADVADELRGGAGATVELRASDLDRGLAALAALADLKSLWTRGHSAAVARRVEAAARLAGFNPTMARRAGWVHDLGRVAVSTSVWDKPGSLDPAERGLVTGSVGVTRTVLIGSAGLAPLADAAAPPTGDANGTMSALVRAACIAQALGEDRAHRPALTPPRHGEVLRRSGLPASAVAAVLAARPQPPVPTVDLPEQPYRALQLACRGATSDAIARRLRTTPRRAALALSEAFDALAVTTPGAAAFAAMLSGLC